jgi:hypothetical protein
MSARNGPGSRSCREGKQNIARRMHTKELLKGAGVRPGSVVNPADPTLATVSA